MSKLANVTNVVAKNVKQHSPELLTGIGIAGMAASVIFTAKATPKVFDLLEAKKDEEGVDKLPPVEIVKVAWKPYIPAVLTFTASTACLIGASSVNARRNAALATVATLSESAMREYKDKVIDTIGDEKEREIRQAIAEDKIKDNPVEKQDVVVTGNGNDLCYESLSGRYFYSSDAKIQKAVNAVNDRMLKYQYVSLNDFFYELGLEPTKLGNELGWNIYRGMITVDTFGDKNQNDRPCLVLDYDRMPLYEFDMMM